MNITRCNPWIGGLLVTSFALAGCAPKTNVSTTGNLPAQYAHAYVSVQEIWFNVSATATPEDTTWIKYALPTPTTVDLAASTDGVLKSLTTGLNVPTGTYAQVRLIPVDPSATPIASAKDLGATYNSEVDYTDTNGAPQPLRLELLNPDKGIGIPTSIQVTGTGVNILASPSSSTSSTSSSSSSTTTAKPFSLAINIDGAKDLVPFAYNPDVNGNNGLPGMLLNPHITAYDTSLAGAVQGTLGTTALDTTTIKTPSQSNFYDIQVTAEALSTDGTRHIPVISTAVKSDGTFTLYPLSTGAKTPTSYDLVIHGPAIATVIIKGVPVYVGDPASATPVNIGTVPLRAANPFTVSLNTANLTTANRLPAGAQVGFYQTLPDNTGVPYAIEMKSIDPFTLAFPTNWPARLSDGSIDYGTFASSGSTIALNTDVNATEGAGTYRVAASAPLFADGPLTSTTGTTTITGATTGAVTVPVVNAKTAGTPIAVPTLSPASGVSAVTTFQVSQTNTFDRGYLIVSHDGSIVATAALDTILAHTGGGSLAITGLPAGTTAQGTGDPALYYVSVRVWNSATPEATVVRETYPRALDLRSTTIATYSLSIN